MSYFGRFRMAYLQIPTRPFSQAKAARGKRGHYESGDKTEGEAIYDRNAVWRGAQSPLDNPHRRAALPRSREPMETQAWAHTFSTNKASNDQCGAEGPA